MVLERTKFDGSKAKIAEVKQIAIAGGRTSEDAMWRWAGE